MKICEEKICLYSKENLCLPQAQIPGGGKGLNQVSCTKRAPCASVIARHAHPSFTNTHVTSHAHPSSSHPTTKHPQRARQRRRQIHTFRVRSPACRVRFATRGAHGTQQTPNTHRMVHACLLELMYQRSNVQWQGYSDSSSRPAASGSSSQTHTSSTFPSDVLRVR